MDIIYTTSQIIMQSFMKFGLHLICFWNIQDDLSSLVELLFFKQKSVQNGFRFIKFWFIKYCFSFDVFYLKWFKTKQNKF